METKRCLTSCPKLKGYNLKFFGVNLSGESSILLIDLHGVILSDVSECRQVNNIVPISWASDESLWVSEKYLPDATAV